jgi:hypothetical protein
MKKHDINKKKKLKKCTCVGDIYGEASRIICLVLVSFISTYTAVWALRRRIVRVYIVIFVYESETKLFYCFRRHVAAAAMLSSNFEDALLVVDTQYALHERNINKIPTAKKKKK